MTYARIFDPGQSSRHPSAGTAATRPGDQRDGSVYVYSDDVVLAVNVALAIQRPLLVSGLPGSGKSSLAPSVAKWLGWRFLSETVTSRTQARDLLWRYDVVKRLSDAQAKDRVKDPQAYIEPGALWWAFDPISAARRGEHLSQLGVPPPVPHGVIRDSPMAVVLIDEIDKADPDVPNSLLEALGSMQFTVEETGFLVEAKDDRPLVIITTNDERELPKAFVRRCATVTLKPPGTKPDLLRVAAAHFPDRDVALHGELADIILKAAPVVEGVPAPSTAEFIDSIRACVNLKLSPDTDDFRRVRNLLLEKRVDPTA